MKSAELQDIIVSILRNLDPDDPAVRSFHEAYRYRQHYATTFEAESDSLGLQAALERAFVIYTPDEVWSGEVPAEGANMFFIIDLAVAAKEIPLDVYERFVGRLTRLGHEPTSVNAVRKIVFCSFCAYARRKAENLCHGT